VVTKRKVIKKKLTKITTLNQCVLPKTLVPITTPDRPQRNKPCPCESGVKFKKCCKDVTTLCDKLKELLGQDDDNPVGSEEL